MPETQEAGWKPQEEQILLELKARLGEDSSQWKWLRKSVLWTAPDLKRATTQEILEAFGPGVAPKGQLVNDSLLLRTMVWQSWIRIQAALEEPVEGNLRSYWYQTVEPFYRRHQLLDDSRSPRSLSGEVVETMTDAIGLFVGHRIFEYGGAFLFEPGMDNLARKGRNQPRIMFFSEKEGMLKLCQWLVTSVESISYMVSNGQPSFINLEYFSKKFSDGRVGTMLIGALCDWDPWGLKIAEQLDGKMRFLGETMGFKVKTYLLTAANLFSEEQIAAGHDLSKLPQKQYGKIVAEWLAKGGGVEGKPIALHLDVIPMAKKKVLGERFIEYAKDGTLDNHYRKIEPVPLSRGVHFV